MLFVILLYAACIFPHSPANSCCTLTLFALLVIKEELCGEFTPTTISDYELDSTTWRRSFVSDGQIDAVEILKTSCVHIFLIFGIWFCTHQDHDRWI